MAVRFDGYGLDKDGKPTFRYRTSEKGLDENSKGAELMIAETPSPLKSLLATGLARKFEVTVPGGQQAWFFAGTTAKAPRAYDAVGKPLKLDLKAAEVSASAVGARVVLPDGDRATVLEAAGAPGGAEWRFVPHKGGLWLAVLKLPEAKAEQKLTFALNLYALPKDDEGLLKELFGP